MDDWLADKVINGVINWFVAMVIGALDVLWELLSQTAFQSPDVTELPQVTLFASTSLGIVNTCYVLAFLATAVMVMARDTVQSHYGPAELIPRLVIGLVAANFAVPLCAVSIDTANALTAALTTQSITSPGSMQVLHSTTTASLKVQNGASPAGFLLVLIALLIAVLVALLMVQWIARCGLLIVLVGISPVALALHGTPFTDAAAKLWWRALAATLGTVVIQAVALHTTLTVFLSPEANLAALGLGGLGSPGATMNLLIVCCLLYGILKVPGLLRQHVIQGRSAVGRQLFRVVVVQQLTRRVALGLGGGRVGPVASAAGAAARLGWPIRPGVG